MKQVVQLDNFEPWKRATNLLCTFREKAGLAAHTLAIENFQKWIAVVNSCFEWRDEVIFYGWGAAPITFIYIVVNSCSFFRTFYLWQSCLSMKILLYKEIPIFYASYVMRTKNDFHILGTKILYFFAFNFFCKGGRRRPRWRRRGRTIRASPRSVPYCYYFGSGAALKVSRAAVKSKAY